MIRYIVGMATFYNQEWHLDYSTICKPTDKKTVIEIGAEITNLGGFPLFREVIDGQMGRFMVAYYDELEYAFDICAD